METRIKLVHIDTLSCEPILRKAPNGDLLCVAECGGVGEPSIENRVYVFRSTDDGETWGQGVSIYPEDGNAVCCTEVMVHEGVITAFLVIHSGQFLDWKCLMMKSHDSGLSWEKAGAPPHLNEYGLIRAMITLQNGNILLPYNCYPIDKKEVDRVRQDGSIKDKGIWHASTPNMPVESGVLLSADGGKTYEKIITSKMPMNNGVFGWIWTEPTIVETSNGRIVMLMRKCGAGFLQRCESNDGGRTWSETVGTDIPNPSNKPKLIKISGSKIALIHTPNSVVGRFGSLKERFPLAIWVSGDGMKTWQEKYIPSDFPGGYCYPDGFYEEGHIKFTIEYNRHDILFFDCRL
jgi:hypothetical protein